MFDDCIYEKFGADTDFKKIFTQRFEELFSIKSTNDLSQIKNKIQRYKKDKLKIITKIQKYNIKFSDTFNVFEFGLELYDIEKLDMTIKDFFMSKKNHSNFDIVGIHSTITNDKFIWQKDDFEIDLMSKISKINNFSLNEKYHRIIMNKFKKDTLEKMLQIDPSLKISEDSLWNKFMKYYDGNLEKFETFKGSLFRITDEYIQLKNLYKINDIILFNTMQVMLSEISIDSLYSTYLLSKFKESQTNIEKYIMFHGNLSIFESETDLIRSKKAIELLIMDKNFKNNYIHFKNHRFMKYDVLLNMLNSKNFNDIFWFELFEKDMKDILDDETYSRKMILNGSKFIIDYPMDKNKLSKILLKKIKSMNSMHELSQNKLKSLLVFIELRDLIDSDLIKNKEKRELFIFENKKMIKKKTTITIDENYFKFMYEILSSLAHKKNRKIQSPVSQEEKLFLEHIKNFKNSKDNTLYLASDTIYWLDNILKLCSILESKLPFNLNQLENIDKI